MLDILKTVTPSSAQWEITFEGMRNSFNSWDRSDSIFCMRNECFGCELKDDCGTDKPYFDIGPDDMRLMLNLAESGSSHSKFRRMLPVWVTVNAPLYWWKEFDTYKVGTVCNSCSTMHSICNRAFTPEDFSHENLLTADDVKQWGEIVPASTLDIIIAALNRYRLLYLETKDKKYWEQIIQLLPSSYNQRRTVMLNYEVLSKIFAERKCHKLIEWHNFCGWIETLPYSELITCGQKPAL